MIMRFYAHPHHGSLLLHHDAGSGGQARGVTVRLVHCLYDYEVVLTSGVAPPRTVSVCRVDVVPIARRTGRFSVS